MFITQAIVNRNIADFLFAL